MVLLQTSSSIYHYSLVWWFRGNSWQSICVVVMQTSLKFIFQTGVQTGKLLIRPRDTQSPQFLTPKSYKFHFSDITVDAALKLKIWEILYTIQGCMLLYDYSDCVRKWLCECVGVRINISRATALCNQELTFPTFTVEKQRSMHRPIIILHNQIFYTSSCDATGQT